MPDLKLTIKGLEKLKAALEKAPKEHARALRTALKVEGYRLRKKLQAEIRAGDPGGRRLAPLSEIAGRTKTGRPRKNPAPLSRLAGRVRYQVGYEGGEIFFRFAFIREAGIRALVLRHAEGKGRRAPGFNSDFGRRLARIGGRLKKKGDPAARFYFIRKDRTEFDLPRRPLVEPFWEAHKAEAERNIARNLLRKLRGERI